MDKNIGNSKIICNFAVEIVQSYVFVTMSAL